MKINLDREKRRKEKGMGRIGQKKKRKLKNRRERRKGKWEEEGKHRGKRRIRKVKSRRGTRRKHKFLNNYARNLIFFETVSQSFK